MERIQEMPDNIRMYDRLSPEEAVYKAWSVAGKSPATHRAAQDRLRREMPLLARALDRLVDSPKKF